MSPLPISMTAVLLPHELLATATADPSDSASPLAPEPGDSATTVVEETVEVVTETTVSLLTLLWKAGLGVLAGFVVAFMALLVLRAIGRRHRLLNQAARYCRSSMYALGAAVGAYIGSSFAFLGSQAPDWSGAVTHALQIAVIGAGAWLITQVLNAVEASVVEGVRAGGDQGRANRVTTQAQILRRVAVAIVIICGLIGVVMTFPSARFAMGSLLASAGLVSVIAGLAAQSTLSNVLAGLQLATTDAIRVDDVVDVDTLHGQIEEITLTYVVVRIWDGRRHILPSTYFTQNPFTNWSRRSQEMLGVVALQVDWRVPVARMRAELARIVAASGQWDGRTSNLLITETSASTVTARVTVSAADPDDLWALQCHVREELVTWMQREAPYALPRTRVEVEQVAVSHDPEPEQVARLAQELVARREEGRDEGEDGPGAAVSGDEKGAQGGEQAPQSDQEGQAPIPAIRLPLHHLRRLRRRSGRGDHDRRP